MYDDNREVLISEWEPALRKAWDAAYEKGDQDGRAFFWLWGLDLKGWSN